MDDVRRDYINLSPIYLLTDFFEKTFQSKCPDLQKLHVRNTYPFKDNACVVNINRELFYWLINDYKTFLNSSIRKVKKGFPHPIQWFDIVDWTHISFSSLIIQYTNIKMFENVYRQTLKAD